MKNLAHLLEERASSCGEMAAYIFLAADETESRRITYRELRTLAQSYSAHFRKSISPGEHVLLILPDEDIFLPVFWGCMYAGIVAIPTPAMDVRSAQRMVPRLKSILADAESKYIVTTRAVREAMVEKIGSNGLEGIKWILTDEVEIRPDLAAPHADWEASQIAVLQYTSGSTSSPKGILLSHGNLMDNFKIIDYFIGQYYPHPENRVCVTWLPYFHDMGLVGTMLQSVYSRYTTVVMKPMDFLQRPLRWLRMIDKYRGVTVTAPNFAYEICRKKATDEDVAKLDLSSLACVMNGSETIRWDSLKKFHEKFKPAGFKLEAFAPVYGLAESTLFVTGVLPGQLAAISVDLNSLQGLKPKFVPEGTPKSVQVVSCGACIQQELKIVNPETRVERQPGEIGEIWVSGKSVANGYWNLKEDSDRMFNAELKGDAGKKYLRTGDLGFISDGNLYFAGRIKDLIIVNGKNHYPQDIELTAEQAHPLIRSGCSVAFSVELGEDHQVALVLEAKVPPRSEELREIRDKVSRAVAQTHGLAIHSVTLIQAGTIFKTSSGKVQRQLTKKMWAKNTLIKLDDPAWSRFWAKLKLLRYVKSIQ